jgi:nuclear transport factor 2 (NTF2) superfamily protein
LKRKWEKELDYRLMKELWCFTENRISVRFEYEWHDANGQWYRMHGNEHWEFDNEGLMRRRDMSGNDYPHSGVRASLSSVMRLGDPVLQTISQMISEIRNPVLLDRGEY